VFAELQASKVKVPETFPESLVVGDVMPGESGINMPWLTAFSGWVHSTAFKHLEAFGTSNKANAFHQVVGDSGGVVKTVTQLEVSV
jgi:hypothetical protein